MIAHNICFCIPVRPTTYAFGGDILVEKKFLISELQIRGSKGYFSIDTESEGVKILNEILDFSIEIRFRG